MTCTTRKGKELATIWVQAKRNVREGLLSVALGLGIDPYAAEMTMTSAEEDFKELSLVEACLRLEFALIREAKTSEEQNERRIAHYARVLGPLLEQKSLGSQDVTKALLEALKEEKDYQTERYLAARQSEVVGSGRESVLTVSRSEALMA